MRNRHQTGMAIQLGLPFLVGFVAGMVGMPGTTVLACIILGAAAGIVINMLWFMRNDEIKTQETPRQKQTAPGRHRR